MAVSLATVTNISLDVAVVLVLSELDASNIWEGGLWISKVDFKLQKVENHYYCLYHYYHHD